MTVNQIIIEYDCINLNFIFVQTLGILKVPPARDQSKFNRINLIQTFIDKVNAEVYLEIGVSKGHSFLHVKCRRKIGVDPQFRISTKNKIKYLRNNFGNKYYEMTSDDFFSRHEQMLVSARPKIVFIDGLHTFEQTLEDCYNSLNHVAEGGVIILHDCNPPTHASATPALSADDAKRKWHSEHPSPADDSGWTGEWCGDTWKTIPFLLKNHAELNVCVLNTDYGLGVVSKKNNYDEIQYRFLPPNDDLVDDINRLKGFDFSFFERNRNEILNLKEMSQLQEIIDLHC